jgi:hypothetical protein
MQILRLNPVDSGNAVGFQLLQGCGKFGFDLLWRFQGHE